MQKNIKLVIKNYQKWKKLIFCVMMLAFVIVITMFLKGYPFAGNTESCFLLFFTAGYTWWHTHYFFKYRKWVTYFPLIMISVPCVIGMIPNIGTNIYNDTYWVFAILVFISTLAAYMYRIETINDVIEKKKRNSL